MAPPETDETRVIWPVMSSFWVAQALALQYQFEQTQWWPAEQLQARQLRQAEQLIRHAAETTPIYRERLGGFVGDLDGGLTMEKVRTLPLLTKSDLQRRGDSVLSQALPRSHGRVRQLRTSGSTGRPLQVATTDLVRMFIWAHSIRSHTWHKRDLTAKNMDIRPMSGPEPGRVLPWNPLPQSGPSILLKMARPIPELFDRLIQEDPNYLQTAPSVLQGLIERSRETGIKPNSLREVRCYGEVLEPDVRADVMSEWGVPLHENYSASEVGTIALQCPESENLHVIGETVLVEVLDDTGKPCGPGDTGQIVVTGLINYAMPFIRYAIDDYATVGGACPCGRGLPVLERVVGRARNFFVLASGEKRLISGGLSRICEYAPILQVQYVQTAIDHVKINVVAERLLTLEEEAVIKTAMIDTIGPEFSYSLDYFDEIPRAPSGKFEILRSEVGQQKPS